VIPAILYSCDPHSFKAGTTLTHHRHSRHDRDTPHTNVTAAGHAILSPAIATVVNL
jgi:hypothetical protein